MIDTVNFFDYIENDAFFKPLTLKHKRIYYDCIQILIEKTKELPVLYESDAKDSITVYLKNVGITETKKLITDDSNVGEEVEDVENTTDLQASGILFLFRECGWLLPREIGRNGEYVVNISIACRRFMDFLKTAVEFLQTRMYIMF